jgi:hypothetical protein
VTLQIEEKDFLGRAVGRMAVEHLAEYVKVRVAEHEKTKRLLIVVVAVLVVVSSFILVFAPAGKELPAAIIGTVLLVLALGAIGASRFILKTPFASIESGADAGRSGAGTDGDDRGRDDREMSMRGESSA